MAVLIDTSILLALAFPKDPKYREARTIMRDLRTTRIVAAPVLPELFYMVASRMDYVEAIKSFNLLRSPIFHIEALTASDMARMQEIMERYVDNKFDFVDAAIMALSERLKIAEVYTFDHRDFRVFRPAHRPYLRILP